MAIPSRAHVLIADITGSTPLYEALPEHEAMAQINLILDRMRSIIAEHGGTCVKSKGDDTLSWFSQADQVFAAARAMIQTDWDHGLAIHAGAYCGELLSQGSDVYGDTVNTAARLSALAKPNEVLLGDTVFSELEDATRALCVSMGGLKLKGKRAPVRVHSYAVSDMSTQTVLFGAARNGSGPRTESVELRCNGATLSLTDGETLMIGRAPDCDAVLSAPWVSRKHGVFELRAAQLEYTDHSSSGSTVITSDGREYALQRRSMLLNGEGMVLIGTSDPAQEGSVVRYATNDLVPD